VTSDDACYGTGQGNGYGEDNGSGQGTCNGQGTANGHWDEHENGNGNASSSLLVPLGLLAFAGRRRRSGRRGAAQ